MRQSVTSGEALGLLKVQLNSWETARKNYQALARIKMKELDFGTFRVKVQFNPARVVSSAAKVDEKSLVKRKCFLCPLNLPEEQQGLALGDDYQMLVNPYPIFPQHWTIPLLAHREQRILPRFGDMLDMAEALKPFILFYNGPKSGASAPDHAHFQVGNRGFLPIEQDWQEVDKEEILRTGEFRLFRLKNYLRNVLMLESSDKEALIRLFGKLYYLLPVREDEPEPGMNILAWKDDNRWLVCLFLREKHRPACYVAEGDANILVSPGAVDMGGVLITPLEKDFDKLTREDIRAIYKEVSLNDEAMEKLVERLKVER